METESFYLKLGQKLAKLRKAEGYTQAEFARKIHMSRASVANVERGQQRIFVHQMAQIVRVLQLATIEDLLPTLRHKKISDDFTISGDELSAMQERELKKLISSIAATSRASSSS